MATESCSDVEEAQVHRDLHRWSHRLEKPVYASRQAENSAPELCRGLILSSITALYRFTMSLAGWWEDWCMFVFRGSSLFRWFPLIFSFRYHFGCFVIYCDCDLYASFFELCRWLSIWLFNQSFGRRGPGTSLPFVKSLQSAGLVKLLCSWSFGAWFMVLRWFCVRHGVQGDYGHSNFVVGSLSRCRCTWWDFLLLWIFLPLLSPELGRI